MTLCDECGKTLEFLEERVFETVDGKKMSLCLKCYEKETSKKNLEKIMSLFLTVKKKEPPVWEKALRFLIPANQTRRR